MQEAKGKTILKVVGILFIIFGAISVIISLLALVGGAALAGASGMLEGADAGMVAAGGAIVIVAGVVALIQSVIDLIAGILGVKNCDKPEKAQTCFILGVVIIVIAIISDIFAFISSGVNASTIISALIGLVLPVLYVVGANKNKQSV